MGKILHLLLLLLKVSVLEFIISVSAFTSPASQPSLSPVYTSMASFSPGIHMGKGQEHKLDAHKKLLIALIITSSSLGLILVSCLCFWVYWSKKSPKNTKNSGNNHLNIKNENKSAKLYICNKILYQFLHCDLSVLISKWFHAEEGESRISLSKKGFVQSFDYKTLEKATGGFKDGNLIGRGGFGDVYKACLGNNTLAAVKKIENVSQEAKREFQVPKQNTTVEYLHERCRPPVIHRDLKSSNILLDSSFNAKISDFGLAVMVGAHGKNNIKLSGTLGYVAPEYLLDGKLTDKSDVYAFGVVLLELLLGRRPVEKLSSVQCQSLVTWIALVNECTVSKNLQAMPQLTDRSKLPKIVDPVIKDTMDHKHLYQVCVIFCLCV
ncbi:serine/threonine protein kinase like protein [Arabidopsis thaliana]|uniref:Serine/threonine protein kinase like protein n=1 Tax=Arabidopsis thaliana TaxID=3702 RepID=O49391_ARATH|nr:serine/threonine protein kinase like protein [Arabidopsis thaliana]CAB79918.1 serine/threonine protein kinase like protein [Arabidopsis thaliana]